MISNPRPGDVVQVWYGPKWRRQCAALHGRSGVVAVASKGKPRNHMVEVEGVEYVVPCGNLRKPKESL